MLRTKLLMILASLLLVVGGFIAFSFHSPSQAYASASMCPSGTTWVNPETFFSPPPPQLEYGSTGNWVTDLQQALNYAYHDQSDAFHNSPYNFHPPLALDGKFGSLTQNAVLDYQIAHHLGVDGIVGPQTWSSLGVCIIPGI